MGENRQKMNDSNNRIYHSSWQQSKNLTTDPFRVNDTSVPTSNFMTFQKEDTKIKHVCINNMEIPHAAV